MHLVKGLLYFIWFCLEDIRDHVIKVPVLQGTEKGLLMFRPDCTHTWLKRINGDVKFLAKSISFTDKFLQTYS